MLLHITLAFFSQSSCKSHYSKPEKFYKEAEQYFSLLAKKFCLNEAVKALISFSS